MVIDLVLDSEEAKAGGRRRLMPLKTRCISSLLVMTLGPSLDRGIVIVSSSGVVGPRVRRCCARAQRGGLAGDHGFFCVAVGG